MRKQTGILLDSTRDLRTCYIALPSEEWEDMYSVASRISDIQFRHVASRQGETLFSNFIVWPHPEMGKTVGFKTAPDAVLSAASLASVPLTSDQQRVHQETRQCRNQLVLHLFCIYCGCLPRWCLRKDDGDDTEWWWWRWWWCGDGRRPPHLRFFTHRPTLALKTFQHVNLESITSDNQASQVSGINKTEENG